MAEAPEDWLSELDSLEAIFDPTEFQRHADASVTFFVTPEEDSSRKFRLKVSPSTLYPEEPPVILIQPLAGNFPKGSIQWLQSELEDFADERRGLPVLFDLVENLKQLVLTVSEHADAGLFADLSPEIFSNIMDYIPPADLASLSQVSKAWNTHLSDDNIWRGWAVRMTSAETVNDYEIAAKKIDPNLSWRKSFQKFQTKWLTKTLRMPFLIPIYERKGTGDEWTSEQVKHWSDTFTKELSELGIFLEAGKWKMQGSRLSDGKFEFYYTEFIDRNFWFTRWYLAAQQFIDECPYVGRIIGYFGWDGYTSLKWNAIQVARGNPIYVRSDSWQVCVQRQRVQLYVQLSRGKLSAASIIAHSRYRFLGNDFIKASYAYAVELRKLINQHKGASSTVEVAIWVLENPQSA